MAQNGRAELSNERLMLGVKQTSKIKAVTSACDPRRTLLRYGVDTVRWGAVVEHSHEHVARF